MSPLEFWYAALHDPIGVKIATNARERAAQKLYQARAQSGDEALAALSIILPPDNPNEIWIVHKQVKTDAPAEE